MCDLNSAARIKIYMMIFSIKATIDRIDGQKAVLLINSSIKNNLPEQEIIWPKEELPPNIQEGDSIVLGILKEEDASKSQEESARAMLEALLSKTKN